MSKKMNTTQISCNLIVIRSSNLERAANFYRALGLHLSCHAHGNGPEHYAFEGNGHTFEIYPLVDDSLPTHSTRIGFAVHSVDHTFTEAVAAGAKPLLFPRDSEWGRRAVIVDPDGHKVELTSPPKH